jgi:hypothetical protein
LGKPNSLNTGRTYLGVTGIQTAALIFGGNPGAPPFISGATEEYDGTTWTTSPEV